MASVMSLSEVKSRLSEVADEIFRTHDRVNVTRNGREFVVIMSAQELESLEATIELLEDRAAQDRIRQAEKDLANGDFTTAESLGKLMEERRRSGR
ncbi:MAG: type II toxin-antitoxin system Phd/YefM family antitoxin [Bifidobacteriaceae bacterium]|jgi:prevent-host-death family protein|nr:type II toxin-antitoxin system Phd/YefM family antitoxin [Bifidobacteriaceae bacterium]